VTTNIEILGMVKRNSQIDHIRGRPSLTEQFIPSSSKNMRALLS
jgi:hypothetical protein